ncbi:MAG TPA: SH3 domain-containing protein [Burkholderiales bacterium]|nr:SH3 domain-containing protein [Burkholderiales bacterium]
MGSRICVFILLACCAALAAAGEHGHLPRAVDLLENPAAGAKFVAKLPRQQAVDVLERRGSWVRVRAGASVGWVKTIDLRLDTGTPAKISAVRAKSNSDSGIRGFSEEELLGASASAAELDKLKQMRVPARDATSFARAAGLKPRKQDYFEGTELATMDIPDDFFDE